MPCGFPVALENQEGVFCYQMLANDPGMYVVLVVAKMPPLGKTEGSLSELGFRKVYFKRTNEVVPNDGRACVVFRQESE